MTSTSIVVYPRAQQAAPRYYDDSYLTLKRLSIDTTAEARRSRSNIRNSNLTYADPLVVVCQPGPRPPHERLSRSLPPLSIGGTTESRRRRSSTRPSRPAYVTTSDIVAIRQPVSTRYYEEPDASLTTIESSSRSRSRSRAPRPVHSVPSGTVTTYRVSPTQPEKRSGSRLRPLSTDTAAESRRCSSTSSFQTSQGRAGIRDTASSSWVGVAIVAETAVTNRYLVGTSHTAVAIMPATGMSYGRETLD